MILIIVFIDGIINQLMGGSILCIPLADGDFTIWLFSGIGYPQNPWLSHHLLQSGNNNVGDTCHGQNMSKR